MCILLFTCEDCVCVAYVWACVGVMFGYVVYVRMCVYVGVCLCRLG